MFDIIEAMDCKAGKAQQKIKTVCNFLDKDTF